MTFSNRFFIFIVFWIFSSVSAESKTEAGKYNLIHILKEDLFENININAIFSSCLIHAKSPFPQK